MASSWGNSWGSSWGDSWGPVTVDPNAMVGSCSFGFATTGTLTPSAIADEPSYGGWAPLQRRRRKTPDEIRAERIALGIIQEPVAKIANKIAQKAIKQAAVSKAPDVLGWALQVEQQALYDRQFRLEMARHKQVWDAAYQRLFEIAIQEALLSEEEAVMLMMFEL